MKKITATLFAFIITFVTIPTSVFAYDGIVYWNQGIVSTDGTVAAPISLSIVSPNWLKGAFAKAHLRQAARLVAARDLYETLRGMSEDIQDTDDFHYQAYVTSTKLGEDFDEYENCTVTIGMPLFGKNSVAKAIIPPYKKEPLSEPRTQTTTNGTYTGLVIDCRGLGAEPGFALAIADNNHRIIYSYKNLDYDAVIANGAFKITDSTNKEDYARAGKNPIVLRAVGKDMYNALISPADADRILAENKRSGFLNQGNVVFLLDKVSG